MTLGDRRGGSTDEILRAVASALQGDRRRASALVTSARERMMKKAGRRARKELEEALARLRGGARIGDGGLRSPAKAVEPRGARLAAPRPLPAPTLRPVRIRLPDQRWVEGLVAPAAARRDDLEALRRVVASNTARAHAAIQHNARAIDALARSQRELATLVAELQARGELALLQGLFDAVMRLEAKLGKSTRVLRTQGRSVARVSRQQRSLRKAQRLQARSARIQQLRSAATTMQTAAFGTRGQLLARNNLVLAGNDLLWSLLGDLLEALGLTIPGRTSPWAWLTPLASLATGQVALANQQHQRFVSGVASTFEAAGTRRMYRLSLEDRIAPALWPRFRERDDVPVTVAPLRPIDPSMRIQAAVLQGVLTIVISLDSGHMMLTLKQLEGVRIAWMVDTGVADG